MRYEDEERRDNKSLQPKGWRGESHHPCHPSITGAAGATLVTWGQSSRQRRKSIGSKSKWKYEVWFLLLNPVVRSGLIWQMLYLMGASCFSILTCTGAILDPNCCEIGLVTGTHYTLWCKKKIGHDITDSLFSCMTTQEVTVPEGFWSRHHLAATSAQMIIDRGKMPMAEPSVWNLSAGHATLPNSTRNTCSQFVFITKANDNTLQAQNAELRSR